MKSYLSLLTGMALLVPPAFASDAPPPSANPPAAPPSRARPASPSDSTVWTKADIETYCRPIASGNVHSHTYTSCIEHQQRRLGRVKSWGDQQDIDNANNSFPQ